MIRDKQYKYISRPDGTDEFYALAEDTQERYNRIEDPAYAEQIHLMQREQLRWYQSTCDVVPWDFDQRFNGEMFWAMLKHHAQNEAEAKILRDHIAAGETMPIILAALQKFRKEQSEEA